MSHRVLVVVLVVYQFQSNMQEFLLIKLLELNITDLTHLKRRNKILTKITFASHRFCIKSFEFNYKCLIIGSV